MQSVSMQTLVLATIPEMPNRRQRTMHQWYGRMAEGSHACEERERKMDISKEILDSLSEEMRDKVCGCDTPEELIALATSHGIDLTDEQLDIISGGDVDWSIFSDQAFDSYTY